LGALRSVGHGEILDLVAPTSLNLEDLPLALYPIA
jgi:hypothetical protein